MMFVSTCGTEHIIKTKDIYSRRERRDIYRYSSSDFSRELLMFAIKSVLQMIEISAYSAPLREKKNIKLQHEPVYRSNETGSQMPDQPGKCKQQTSFRSCIPPPGGTRCLRLFLQSRDRHLRFQHRSYFCSRYHQDRPSMLLFQSMDSIPRPCCSLWI
jgi:hypothetical protein